MSKEDNEVLTEDVEVESVKMRKVGGVTSLTVPTIFRKLFRFLRSSEALYFEPRVERTSEGKILIVFELENNVGGETNEKRN